MEENTYHVTIETAPGIIIKKVCRGPKTAEDAKAEIERQQKIVIRTGDTAMPAGIVTVTPWLPTEPPPPPKPHEGQNILIPSEDERKYEV